MRTISEMYMRSGGCLPFHYCGNCEHFKPKEKKVTECAEYTRIGGQYQFWKSTWVACKFFKEISKKSSARTGTKKARERPDDAKNTTTIVKLKTTIRKNQCEGQLSFL